jgi:hypothetical protein
MVYLNGKKFDGTCFWVISFLPVIAPFSWNEYRYR